MRMDNVAGAHDPMITEWVAWRNWCERFSQATGMDINDTDKFRDMVDAVKLWGEELCLLRRTQGISDAMKYLHELRETVEVFVE